MKLLKYLLLPFSLLYGAVIFVRNKFYDFKLLPSTYFDQLPVIVLGNLSVGGTGKTPHVEYLLRLLTPTYRVATLSRGYGRKTSGFLIARPALTALDIGDEPKQYDQKFENIIVAVDEDRVHGITTLLQLTDSPHVVLLDDAYQHRALKPGFSILLTDYAHLYCNDHLLPVGRLRESRAGAKRADCIIVTKAPAALSVSERIAIINKLKPLPNQQVYFTHLRYGAHHPLFNKTQQLPDKLNNYTVLVLTGIADPAPLLEQLKPQFQQLLPLSFPDHHLYSVADLMQLTRQFEAITNPNKVIITTEKDAMRLLIPELAMLLQHLPVYYLPIEIVFNDDGSDAFDKKVIDFVSNFN
jgi:tetraacyldisaccharide 4'-kinase